MPFKKVCLPSSKETKPKEGSACWITGWTKGLKKKLKSVNVNILPAKYCDEYKGQRYIFLHFAPKFAENFVGILCFSNKDKMKDGRYSCVVFPDKPDKNIHLESKFGGPLVCLNENESFELQGIAATESLSINDGNAALFTNIYNNLGWLEEKMSAWTEWTPCSTECSRQRNRVCTKAGYKIDVSSSGCLI